ncbi:Uncharacterised protein [Vibrio cholerae]|nr:Uncharacterised protein [Vibrio cholerae]CSI79012.1 Uncharacterised protein [Vibrio cholerae]
MLSDQRFSLSHYVAADNHDLNCTSEYWRQVELSARVFHTSAHLVDRQRDVKISSLPRSSPLG